MPRPGPLGVSLASLAIALASCTGNGDTAPPPPSEPDSDPNTGRLAIIDGDGNVAVVDPDGGAPLLVTDDVGPQVRYSQPVWGPDGEALSWARFDEEGGSLVVGSVDGPDMMVETPAPPFYVSWSPTGEELAMLHNNATSIEFSIISAGDGSVRAAGEGSPFYFSWSPDGGAVVAHVGEEGFQVIPGADDAPIGGTSPGYQAPLWLEEGIIHVSGQSLVISGDDGHRELADLGGFANFVGDPTGSRIAIQTFGGGGPIAASVSATPSVPNEVVAVVEMDGSESEIVFDEPVLGFFWSPDGTMLLLMAATPGRDGLTSWIWEEGGGLTRQTTFRPPPGVVREMYPFFSQYAQSISFWAPDSSAYAFAGEIDGRRGIWIQDVEGGVPEWVSGGSWVAWSP